jgi:hypothetical protein
MLRPFRHFANFIDAENRAGAVADKHVAVRIEGQSGRDAEFTCETEQSFKLGDAIDGAVQAARHEHLSARRKRNCGRDW